MRNGIKIYHIVARNFNNYIGKDNSLMWHNSEDLKRFKRLTDGGIVVMGRKTYDSLPATLSNRTSYVLSNTLDVSRNDIKVYTDINTLLDAACTEAKDKNLDNIWVIGGSEIFGLTEDETDDIFLTQINDFSIGDTTYDVDLSKFNLIEKEFVGDVSAYHFSKKSVLDLRKCKENQTELQEAQRLNDMSLKNLRKQQMYIVILAVVLFAFGFLNIISNIMQWHDVNNVIDYIRFGMLVILLWLTSRTLNLVL